MIVSYMTQYSRYIQNKNGLILESDQKKHAKNLAIQSQVTDFNRV